MYSSYSRRKRLRPCKARIPKLGFRVSQCTAGHGKQTQVSSVFKNVHAWIQCMLCKSSGTAERNNADCCGALRQCYAANKAFNWHT